MSRTQPVHVERRVDEFKTKARDRGVKLTHQRLEIFRELASSTVHPDAETILRNVQGRMPTMSLDTVYRTLWMLTDMGLITMLGPRRNSVRFDANLERHHHYICTQCGLVRDFHSAEFDALTVPATARRFGQVVEAHVEIRGICEACARPGTRTRLRPTARPTVNKRNKS